MATWRAQSPEFCVLLPLEVLTSFVLSSDTWTTTPDSPAGTTSILDAN